MNDIDSLKPKIRFKEFKEVWEKKKLDDILQERNEQYPKDKNYPLMAFVANYGIVDKGEKYNREALVNDSETKKYKRTEIGDFIYSSNNLETGSIGLNTYGNACISPVYSIFKPIDELDSDFIGRRLIRKEFINKMIKWRQGVIYGQWKIHESDFLKLDICVPNYNEQQQIGKFLKEVDDLISLNQCKYKKLVNIKSSLLGKMFPTQKSTEPSIRFNYFNDEWEKCKFDDLCSIVTKQTGFDYTSTIKNALVTSANKNTLPYLQTKNFSGININYNTDYYILRNIAKDFPKINLDEKCLLFSIVGASVGNIGFFPGEKHCFLSGAICVAKFINKDNAGFLYHYMSSNNGQSQIQLCTKGGAQATVTIEDIRNFSVDLPSIDERMKIDKFLSSLDKLINLQEMKINKLNNIKKSLFDNLFV